MTELIIADNIAEQLRQIAEQENRPLDAVLSAMLESYAVVHEPSDWPVVMADMADAATDITWNAYAPDLSERSRDILDAEFGDYLLKRLREDGNDSP